MQQDIEALNKYGLSIRGRYYNDVGHVATYVLKLCDAISLKPFIICDNSDMQLWKLLMALAGREQNVCSYQSCGPLDSCNMLVRNTNGVYRLTNDFRECKDTLFVLYVDSPYISMKTGKCISQKLSVILDGINRYNKPCFITDSMVYSCMRIVCAMNGYMNCSESNIELAAKYNIDIAGKSSDIMPRPEHNTRITAELMHKSEDCPSTMKAYAKKLAATQKAGSGRVIMLVDDNANAVAEIYNKRHDTSCVIFSNVCQLFIDHASDPDAVIIVRYACHLTALARLLGNIRVIIHTNAALDPAMFSSIINFVSSTGNVHITCITSDENDMDILAKLKLIQ